MVAWPRILENIVSTVALPFIVSEKLPCWGWVNTVATWRLYASGRVNMVLKMSLAFWLRLPAFASGASLESISAVASSAACMAVRADAARL